MQTTRGAETAGYTSVIDGNGTQIVKVVIRNNTFGTKENPVDGFAIKFGRRQNGAEIAIEGNTVYGATVGSTEYFSILDLWQSGGNTYNDLTIAMKGNASSARRMRTATCTSPRSRRPSTVRGTP